MNTGSIQILGINQSKDISHGMDGDMRHTEWDGMARTPAVRLPASCVMSVAAELDQRAHASLTTKLNPSNDNHR